MNIINRKLSELQIGKPVHLTQTNGQIIEGILTENDKSESLSVQIVTTVTLRYSNIAGIEENNTFNSITVLPASIPQLDVPQNEEIHMEKVFAEAKTDDIYSCTEKDVRKAFDEMDSDSKKTMNPILNKIISGLKNHEDAKIEEAAALCQKKAYDIDNQKGYNFCGYVCLLSQKFYNASQAFYDAGDVVKAYRLAYHDAQQTNNDKSFLLSATFATLYICGENTENCEEAIHYLTISSEKCNDLTGFKYIISHHISYDVMSAIRKSLSRLGTKYGQPLTSFEKIDDYIKLLTPYYQSSKIITEIKKYMLQEEPVESEIHNEVSEQKESVPIQSEFLKGKMIAYNFLIKNGGKIQDADGKIFEFKTNDISDISLQNQVKKRNGDFEPIPVEFKPERRNGKDCATNIKRGMTIPAYNTSVSPNVLFTQKKYEEALEAYMQKINTEYEEYFSQTVQCCIALWNQTNDSIYNEKIKKLIDKYFDKVSKTTKNLEAIKQYYMRVQNYSGCLDILNSLLDTCENDECERIIQYTRNKEICYRNIRDYQSAIGELFNLIDIRKKNSLERDFKIYIELAECYFEIEDYENTEKYINLYPTEDERKMALLEELNTKKAESVIEEDDIDSDDEDNSDDEISMTLQEAYDEYTDENISEINDADIIDRLKIFDEKHLYCLLAWLSAFSKITQKASEKQKSALNDEFTMAQAVQGIEGAFSYAYHNPLAECNYTSSQIIALYEISQKFIPELNDELMASAVLRTLFSPSAQDYYLDDLIYVIENSKTLTNNYPMLVNVLKKMKSFSDNTGCTIDSFSDYRSNRNVIDNIIEEAKELQKSIDSRSKTFESQGQVRRLRETMLSDEESDLRKCLNIVAGNNTNEIDYVKSSIEKLFIRNNRLLTIENIDSKKIDAYIDKYWDKARDLIISESRHIERPHDKIKGSKRMNITNTIKKIISCICNWLSIAEHSTSYEEEYIKRSYDEIIPQITDMFEEMYKLSAKLLKEKKFNWGTNSIHFTIGEMLTKIKGTYNQKTRKYFFIGFLSGEDVLLDEDYLPELQSTFCKWDKICILNRIEHHAKEKTVSFEKRISQIFSDDETKHNFRTAKLIKAYAEESGNTELAENTEFEQMNACLKQAKKRFESTYQNFSNEIKLFETYGRISDINGEKTSILKVALDWYKITRITNDFGFYIKMLDFIKNWISANAIEKGKSLMRQLEDLADNPEYDFGVYSKETIKSYIEDQNYSSAESILNCIRRHDTKEVHDYTTEPLRYLSEFIAELSINYRVVTGADSNIVDKVLRYTGKADIEKALRNLTNNVSKEIKGGTELLKNWPKKKKHSVNQECLQKLLGKLGFIPVSITPEENSNDEIYKVYCKKKTGKVTYPHCIPAFGSLTETEGFRVACLYGKYDCNSLMSSFYEMNSTAVHTIVLLDYTLNIEERRKLARKIKEEKSFSKTFIVIDRVTIFYLAKHYSADTISKRLMAITLPFAYYQPFVEASTQTMPAELFTGREEELTSIESPGGANLVYGGRQLGKSALLKMAQHNIDMNSNNDRAILLDVQYKNYKEVAKLLSQELITSGILDESCECDNWDDLSRHIKKRLMDENPKTRINYLLIMLDEADEFIRTSAEDDNPPITSVKNLPSGRFKLVMAGLHNLSRFNREMLQGNSNLIHLSSVVIKQFKRPEAIKLLTNTLAYLGLHFDEKMISVILARTNYYPGLIQFYCQKLLEAMKNDDYAGYEETKTPPYEVNEKHIEKVLSDSTFTDKVNEKLEASLFTEEKGHSHYHIISLIFAYLCYNSDAEKYTIDDIMKIAKAYNITRLVNLSNEQIQELLNEMWDLNILSKEDEHYRFMEGFRELLGDNKKVEDSMSEYCEEDIR